jgi:hypothetical protein
VRRDINDGSLADRAELPEPARKTADEVDVPQTRPVIMYCIRSSWFGATPYRRSNS